MRQDDDPAAAPGGSLLARSTRWLVEMPPPTRRTVRMEALIARLRLALLAFNALVLAFFLDTSRMHLRIAWWLIAVVMVYGLFVVAVRPYERWRIFRTSMLTTLVDAIATAAFIGATGGSHSPFYPIYFLVAVSVGLRFDLRQSLVGSAVFAFTYAIAFFVTWGGTADEFGELALRCVYMAFAAVGVGYLAREENSRSQQVETIEKLNAENARLLSRTERAARIDRLTGLLNRASLEKEALREVRKVRAAGGYLSVLFCDMDRLKRINDELGHDIGDRVLKQVGSALRQRLRAQDLVGRYGGDEFVVILPNLTRETAYDRAEQLIAQVAAVGQALPEDLQVGLSVGVATFPFDAQDYPTLVKVADQAMYLGKREGGNRVRTANDLRLFWEEMPRPA